MESEKVVAELTVPGRAESLRLIRAFVRDTAGACGAEPDWTRDLVLAVDEACQNVVRHGYGGGTLSGDIGLQVAADSRGLTVRISDSAPPVGPEGPAPRPLGELRPGGLGIHLMRSLTDEWRWESPRSGVGNVLRLRKEFTSNSSGGEVDPIRTGEVDRQ